jgi:hypothetical protein
VQTEHKGQQGQQVHKGLQDHRAPQGQQDHRVKLALKGQQALMRTWTVT